MWSSGGLRCHNIFDNLMLQRTPDLRNYKTANCQDVKNLNFDMTKLLNVEDYESELNMLKDPKFARS